jgi:hypothetical protein
VRGEVGKIVPHNLDGCRDVDGDRDADHGVTIDGQVGSP